MTHDSNHDNGKPMILRRGDARKEVRRILVKYLGEGNYELEDEVVDFITSEVKREKIQYQQHLKEEK